MKVIAGIVFVLAIVGICYGLYLKYTKKGQQKLKDNERKIAEQQEQAAESNRVLKDMNAMQAGKYLTGHPTLIQSVEKVVVGYDNGKAVIIQINGPALDRLATIPLLDIKNVSAEDVSTVEKRVSASRYLSMGNLAYLAPKEVRKERHYVTIEWQDGKFAHETIFEFEGKDSIAKSNAFRSALIQQANAVSPS